MNNNKTSEIKVGDIVTIAKDYKDSANFDINQPQINVYTVNSVNANNTISLDGVWAEIPAKYIEGVPLNSKLTKQIYYDTKLHARPYEPGKVYQNENIYSRQPFMVTMEKSLVSTPIWEDMQTHKFHYVHEMQHWLIEHYSDNGICINQFFGMRKPVNL